jgi:hypothetical protein
VRTIQEAAAQEPEAGARGGQHGKLGGWLTRQHQARSQAAVLSKQHVCVQAVAHHADLVAPQPKRVSDIGKHEVGGLAHHRRLVLG